MKKVTIFALLNLSK